MTLIFYKILVDISIQQVYNKPNNKKQPITHCVSSNVFMPKGSIRQALPFTHKMKLKWQKIHHMFSADSNREEIYGTKE